MAPGGRSCPAGRCLLAVLLLVGGLTSSAWARDSFLQREAGGPAGTSPRAARASHHEAAAAAQQQKASAQQFFGLDLPGWLGIDTSGDDIGQQQQWAPPPAWSQQDWQQQQEQEQQSVQQWVEAAVEEHQQRQQEQHGGCGRGWQQAPTCSGGAKTVTTDAQGCGWGYEAGRSCAIRQQQAVPAPPAQQQPAGGAGCTSKGWLEAPACSGSAPASTTDALGCRWGWEGGRSCAVRPGGSGQQQPQQQGTATPAPATAPPAPAATQPGSTSGCGKGWLDAPACSRNAQTLTTDPQGCAWGWEGGRSCAIGSQQQQQQPSAPVCSRGWVDAPACSSSAKVKVVDKEGCSWGFEYSRAHPHGHSCAIRQQQQPAAPAEQAQPAPAPPATQPEQPREQQPSKQPAPAAVASPSPQAQPSPAPAAVAPSPSPQAEQPSLPVASAPQQPQALPTPAAAAAPVPAAAVSPSPQQQPAAASPPLAAKASQAPQELKPEGASSAPAAAAVPSPSPTVEQPVPSPVAVVDPVPSGTPKEPQQASTVLAAAAVPSPSPAVQQPVPSPVAVVDPAPSGTPKAPQQQQAPTVLAAAAVPSPSPAVQQPVPSPVAVVDPVPSGTSKEPQQASTVLAAAAVPSPSPAVQQPVPSPVAVVDPAPSGTPKAPQQQSPTVLATAAVPSPSPAAVPAASSQPLAPDAWRNANLRTQDRVASLLSVLTMEEKAGLMIHGQAGVPRIGLKPFQFWTECLHGHQEQHDGALPTIFPQPLMLAGSWDTDLAHRVFTAISDELRAKSNDEFAKTGIHKYLSCWTPHINLFKDPRWGRGSETFGEDPALTAAFTASIVTGLQGNDTALTKVVATCKHFLGYGVEGAEGVSRYNHNYDITPQDLADTELPPFQACIQAAHGQGIMCSYNAVNGEPSCGSSALLQGLLRDTMGFEGYVVSDCNAVAALKWGHSTAATYAEAAGMAVRAGVDMLCDRPEVVQQAVAAGTLNSTDLDRALSKTLAMRFITGQFDPPASNPWASLTVPEVVNSKEHRLLAREVVQKGAVLLKNEPTRTTYRPVLPLDATALRKVCVVGPLADSPEHMMGNYYGKWDAAAVATPRKAITEALAKSGAAVSYASGIDLSGTEIHYDWPLEGAIEACADADVGIVVVGSSMVDPHKQPDGSFKPATEGEGLDRTSLRLPGHQADLIKALDNRTPNVPLVVVLMHGGSFDVAWMNQVPSVKGILSLPFPGQEGGRGLANLLFGRVSPSGRLPVTWYNADYISRVSPLHLGMRPVPARNYPGRSYRFLQEANYVLYPFGHGLSYTTFGYSGMKALHAGDPSCPASGPTPAVCINVTVTNMGAPGSLEFTPAAEHIVPLYLRHVATAGTRGNPQQSLRAFQRTRPLAPGESQTLTFALNRQDFSMTTADEGEWTLFQGFWQVSAGVWDAPSAAELPAVAAASRTAPQHAAHHSEYPEASESEDVALTSQLMIGSGDGTTTVHGYHMLGGSRPAGSSVAAGTAAGSSAEPASTRGQLRQDVVYADSRTGLSVTIEVGSQAPQALYAS